MQTNSFFDDMAVIDLSHPLSPDLIPYPGDPPLSITRLATVDNQGYCLNQISGTAHIGTHIDAPAHFFQHGKTIENYPASHWFGQALVIDAVHRSTITLENTDIPDLTGVDYLLFHTGWDTRIYTSEYMQNHPVIDPALADRLVLTGLKGIGMDGPGPDMDPYPVHQKILGADMILIENMTNLGELPRNQTISIMVLPLRLSTEASWVRPLAFIPLHT